MAALVSGVEVCSLCAVSVPFPVSAGVSAVPGDGTGRAQVVSCRAPQLLIPADPRGTLEPLPSGCRACPAKAGLVLPGVWHCW